MARLTLPRLHKETHNLVKMRAKLSSVREYLHSLTSNPRGGDSMVVAHLADAREDVVKAVESLDSAIASMAAAARLLEARK